MEPVEVVLDILERGAVEKSTRMDLLVEVPLGLMPPRILSETWPALQKLKGMLRARMDLAAQDLVALLPQLEAEDLDILEA